MPALLYLAVNSGHGGSEGWGIPMATDIAFALGLLTLLGPRVPASMKLFLLGLAVVDDVGAVLVIAVFYSDDIVTGSLVLAAAAVVTSLVLRRLGVHWAPIHIALGILCWQAAYDSGVHATIAGVAFGLATPARPTRRPGPAHGSPVEAAEHVLHPITSYAVVPLFALANAGVALSPDAFEGGDARRVAIGVAVGLIVGKLGGVVLATALAVRFGPSSLPAGASWSHVAGVAALAGIGFTVSLFVADLAFSDPALGDAATVAVLGASLVAAALGSALLLRRAPT